MLTKTKTKMREFFVDISSLLFVATFVQPAVTNRENARAAQATAVR